MILELDLGNTRGKWRILDSRAAVRASGVGSVDAWVGGELPSAWFEGVRRVRAASVLGAALNAALAERLRREFGVPVDFAVSSASCAGVQNAYAEPARLGVDRWLALIAAYRQRRTAVMVVDAGSALTVDVVEAAGRHLGGYIVPGARLMERALLDGTERVRFEDGEVEGFGFGGNTGDCVRSGIVAAQCGAVLVAMHAAEMQLGRRPVLVISGGWGVEAQKYLAQLGVGDISVIPDLVLDGLCWVLPD